MDLLEIVLATGLVGSGGTQCSNSGDRNDGDFSHRMLSILASQ
jgi:hypothetical protein